MSKNIRAAGTPKKPRWSAAKKAARTAGPKKPHRGQGAGSARPVQRAYAPAGEDSGRPGGSGSAERPAGYDQRPSGQRTGRPARPSREDRAAERARGARTDGTSRYPRDSRTEGEGRPQRRPEYNPGERPQRRPYSDRVERSTYDRSERPQRRTPSDRAGGPAYDRTARPADNRTDGTERPRYDRDASRPRVSRHDNDFRPQRTPRFDRDARAERGSGPQRPPRYDRAAERPRYERAPASSGPSHAPAPLHTTPAAGVRGSRERQRPEPVAVAADNAFAALGLPALLVERLARDGITEPFPIQLATIPDALAGRDVLGRGQTGSGKTFAFGLPTLARLAQGARAKPRLPRAVVLTPTRELAMQVSDALQPMVHVLGLRHKLVAGGMPYPPQLAALDSGVDLLVATPGRLEDLIQRGACDLGAVEVMILDEADHMAEMGFLPEISEILDRIPEGGQRLLFSATLDAGVDVVVQQYLVNPVTHSTDDASASVTTMEHRFLQVEPKHKKVITAQAAARPGRTLAFVRTKLGADRVAEQLREQGVLAAALHGGLSQGARNRVLGAFRDGSLPVLVATDVAARGIHVDDVGLVLQVDPPADHKDYLHRAGRTARAGDNGIVATLVLPHQRRGVERLARDAGVEVRPTTATPGDAALTELTDGALPSGVPIPEHQVRRLLDDQRPQPRRRMSAGRPARPKGAGYSPSRGRPHR